MLIKELPYFADNAVYFNYLRTLSDPVWLDSAYPHTTQGRYDILAALPQSILKISNNRTLIGAPNNFNSVSTDIFSLLQKTLSEQKKNIVLSKNMPSLPFYGGAIGFCSYDFGQNLLGLINKKIRNISLPDAYIAIYSWAIVTDHLKKKTYFVSYLSHAEINNIYLSLLKQGTRDKLQVFTNFQLKTTFKAEINFVEYAAAFKQIQRYLAEGECYQINYSQRFTAEYVGDVYAAYLALRSKNPAPFSAYFPCGQSTILSFSPECFISVKDKQASTFPIKGTIARGENAQEDKRLAARLMSSQKDHAENIMIVDLMRNDFNKICLPRSVRVERLCQLESFANVHHLVSQVTGKLPCDKTALDLLKACFPGGSITGAPKYRVVQLIDSLEAHRRHIYCGSIFSYDIFEQFHSNIAIRTMLAEDSKLYLDGGGGIVRDSVLETEYAESITKVQKIMSLLHNKGELYELSP